MTEQKCTNCGRLGGEYDLYTGLCVSCQFKKEKRGAFWMGGDREYMIGSYLRRGKSFDDRLTLGFLMLDIDE